MNQMDEHGKQQNELRLRELWKFLEDGANGPYYLKILAGEPPLPDKAVVFLHPQGIEGPVEEWPIAGAARIKHFEGNERRGDFELYWLDGVSTRSPIVAAWDGYAEQWHRISVEDGIREGYDAVELVMEMEKVWKIKEGHYRGMADRCMRGMGEIERIAKLGR